MENEPALHLATRRGHVEVVRLLLEARADADVPWDLWEDSPLSPSPTPLSIAYDSGHMEIVGLLLQARADANDAWTVGGSFGHYGPRPLLYHACESGDLDLAGSLLQAGADVDARASPSRAGDCWTYQPWPLRPLCAVLRDGHIDMVRLLLQGRADPNEDEDEDPPLCKACSSGSLEKVRLLLEARADANAPIHDDCYGRASSPSHPLCRAAEHGNVDVVRLLLDSRADVNAGVLQTSVHEDGESEGSACNRRVSSDRDRDQPLREASRRGNSEMVRLLLEARANPNKPGWRPPLLEAREAGRVEIVQSLLEARADSGAADKAEVEIQGLLGMARAARRPSPSSSTSSF